MSAKPRKSREDRPVPRPSRDPGKPATAHDGGMDSPLAPTEKDGVRRGPYERDYDVVRGYDVERTIILP